MHTLHPPASLIFALPFASAVLAVPPGWSATLRVPDDLPRISDALAQAAPGDSILVGSGTYSPMANGESFPLVIGVNGVSLIGGGAGQSIIDAEDQASVIRMAAAIGGRVSGFTITRGRAFEGGGVLVIAGAPEIDHNLLLQNGAESRGSGIFVTGSSDPWIHHNVVWESYDTDVQGGPDPHGIQIQEANGRLENNLLGRGDGNGLFIASVTSNPVVRNNIFYENGIPGVRGRGICHFGGPNTVIAYNLFHGNAIAAFLILTPKGGRDMTVAEGNDYDPDDGIFANLDGDPLFVDPDGGDWHLLLGSPAIDSGDPTSPPDPDGTRVDIGPFYFHQGATGAPEATPGLRIVLSSHPNPFSVRADLTYGQAAPGRARLAIYDVLGRRIATLVDGFIPAGTHTTVWDGRNDRGVAVGSGIYFARLESAGESLIRKLVLAP